MTKYSNVGEIKESDVVYSIIKVWNGEGSILFCMHNFFT